MPEPLRQETKHDYYEAVQANQPPVTVLPNEATPTVAGSLAASKRQVEAANANVAKPAPGK